MYTQPVDPAGSSILYANLSGLRTGRVIDARITLRDIDGITQHMAEGSGCREAGDGLLATESMLVGMTAA